MYVFWMSVDFITTVLQNNSVNSRHLSQLPYVGSRYLNDLFCMHPTRPSLVLLIHPIHTYIHTYIHIPTTLRTQPIDNSPNVNPSRHPASTMSSFPAPLSTLPPLPPFPRVSQLTDENISCTGNNAVRIVVWCGAVYLVIYYTILYYTKLYYTILYYAIPRSHPQILPQS